MTPQELYKLWCDNAIYPTTSFYRDAWGNSRSWVHFDDLPNLKRALISYDVQQTRAHIESCRRRLHAGPASLEAEMAKLKDAAQAAEAVEARRSKQRLLNCSTQRVVGVALAAEAAGGRCDSNVRVTDEPELPEDDA